MDDNDENRMGYLSPEEAFLLNDWSLRQLGRFVLTYQTNPMLGNSNFTASEEEKNQQIRLCQRFGQRIDRKR